MSGLLKNLLGGNAPKNPSASPEDADFADFAGAPQPSPASSVVNVASSSLAASASTTPGSGPIPIHARPYTKWYRVWERVEISDFYSELYLIPFLLALILVHVWGTRTNKRKARAWASAHKPILDAEYALVGFERLPKFGGGDAAGGPDDPMSVMKQATAVNYTTYATGRQNVAFTDIKLSLARRHNPPARIGESALGFFFESQPVPVERMEATSYAFDGKEADLAPLLGAQVTEKGLEPPTPEQKAAVKGEFRSAFDGFVFAVVNKDLMKRLREERYDLSLTSTKDHQRLPGWATLMSESAEIAEGLLTPELVKAIDAAGDRVFEALIVSDMPIDAPKKLNDITPRKRISLSLRLPPSNDYSTTTGLFRYFLRLPDQLAHVAHYRPEAMRRVKATREDEYRKIKTRFENEAAEERRAEAEKQKKLERERKLRGLSAEEQRKALERERAMDLRRGQKKRSMRA